MGNDPSNEALESKFMVKKNEKKEEELEGKPKN